MSSKPNTLVTILLAASLLLSGVNTYLILSSQGAQDTWNRAASASLSDLGARIDKTNTDMTALDQSTKALIESRYGDLLGQLATTNGDVAALRGDLTAQGARLAGDITRVEASVQSVNGTLDAHMALSPATIYDKVYRSVVLIWNSAGQGSGFLIDGDRHIVTNWHVVSTGTNIEVEYYDGTTVTATIVGVDPYSDLAVLVASDAPRDVAPLKLADSDACRIGDSVVAVGNPLGTAGSLSSGYISRKNVEVTFDAIPLTITELQCDLTIAPGSSGGALVNLDGEALGVTNGASGGYAVAVPSNMVRRVADSIIEKGIYQHAMFGWTILELNRDNIAYYNVFNVEPTQTGLMVYGLGSGYPAEKAGVQAAVYKLGPSGRYGYEAKDIIIAVDGHAVRTWEDYAGYVEENVAPGVEVDVTLWRSGNIQHVKITPTFRPQYT